MTNLYLLMAQILGQENQTQEEYLAAYAMIAALVLLGIIVICVPRPRKKHFVEPETKEDDKKTKSKKLPKKV